MDGRNNARRHAEERSAKIARWAQRFMLSLCALFVIVIGLGIVAESTMTPQDRARYAAEAKKREEGRVLADAQKRTPAVVRGSKRDRPMQSSSEAHLSEDELRSMAAELGMKYTPDTPGIVVTKAEYGDKWPYLVGDEATLRCTRGVEPGTGRRPVATIEIHGSGVYGLNAPALGLAHYMNDRQLRIKNEWGYPVGGPGGHADFLERALTICGD